jgi:hypothetical protein
MSTMTWQTAIAAEWREVPLEGKINITIQNQGWGGLWVCVRAAAPPALEAPSMYLTRMDREMFAALEAGDKVFIRCEQGDDIQAMIWK